MACQKIEVCLWRTQWKFYRRFLHGPPISKKKILLTVLLPADAMASSTLLRLQIPFHVIDTHNSSSKAMKGGTATWAIVPREWDDQNATSPEHSNQRKKRSISKPVIFLQNCGHWKAATDPRTQVQPLPSNKSGSTSRLESVISSLLVILIRIFLKETTCIVPPGSGKVHTVSRERGEGKDWTCDKNKIRSTA